LRAIYVKNQNLGEHVSTRKNSTFYYKYKKFLFFTVSVLKPKNNEYAIHESEQKRQPLPVIVNELFEQLEQTSFKEKIK
jgi:hypothetical protein